MLSSLDLLPTLAKISNVELPNGPMDGRNVWELISGNKNTKNPHEYYAFSTGKNFESVMSGDGKWKLHLPHKYSSLNTPGKDGTSGFYDNKKIELSLFDMENDPYESENVIEKYPDMATHLKKLADAHKAKFYSEK